MHKLSYNEFQHDSFLLGVAKWIGFVNNSCMNNLNEIQELFQFSFCESVKMHEEKMIVGQIHGITLHLASNVSNICVLLHDHDWVLLSFR